MVLWQKKYWLTETEWHIYAIADYVIIGLDDDLSPSRCRAVIEWVMTYYE